MSNLQIKNVPGDLHDRLRRRAARENKSMRDYLVSLIERDLALPSVSEWLEEIDAGDPGGGSNSASDLVEAARRSRDRELDQGITPGP